ncbi:retrovirus-related pol polyprotein from transposon TNT 1-94 [Tanacetum coccineum]
MNNVCAACNKSLVFANHTDCLVMCDGSVNVKPHQTKHFKRQPKKEWKPIKRVWKPISKPVANSKPQWKPTGRHFSLFEKYPLTRIMEPTDMPIELPPSASSSPKITMVSRFTDHKLSDRKAGSKGISVQIVLWYLDSGCSRHMTGDHARLINFIEKFIGTVRFGNDEYAAIVGFGDYKLGDTIISRVYYVEGLKHNLFSVGQFCDGGLEVAFRQHSCHIRNYDMVDLLKGSRTTNLYSISLNDMMSASPVCLLTKASSTNHGYGIVDCKSKKASHPLRTENTNTEVLHTLHMDLCGPMRTESINGKKYVLVIVDDYTRFGWVRFLRSKDETPQVIEKFIVKTQRALNATVRFVRTDNGTSNELLMEVLVLCSIFAKASLFLWADGSKPLRVITLIDLLYTRFMERPIMTAEGKEANLQYFRVVCTSKKAPRTSTNDFCDKQLQNATLLLLQSGRSRSALVKDPEPPSVPPTKKQVDDLFQWFDDDEVVPIPPVVPITPVNVPAAPAPENANGSPSTTVISEGAPTVTESLLPHQIPLPDTIASSLQHSVNIGCFSQEPITSRDNSGLKHIRLINIIGDKDPDLSLPGNS